MDKKELKKATNDIQAYCISHDDCAGCMFYIKNKNANLYKPNYCMFLGFFGEGDAPTDWDTKAIK